MKKAVFTSLFTLLITAIAYPKKVDPETAKAVASRFIAFNSSALEKRSDQTPELVYTSRGRKQNDPRSYFYVFNMRDTRGFLIVAADDLVYPILAYSDEKHFDPASIPSHVAAWLEGYERQISFAAAHMTRTAPVVTAAWRKLRDDIQPENLVTSPVFVKPLISTKWNQSPYYNAFCPGTSVTGCIATSMAQLMKYWNHPSSGTGEHSYHHKQYGRLSANFEMHTYEWDAMPDSISRANADLAALMYHCGVSVEMDYSSITSNAYLLAAGQAPSAEHALKNYFGFSKQSKGIRLDDAGFSTWLSILKNELNAKRPVPYGGFGTGGGHCFITDGYDENDYFHINWGWGGAFDGYFLLTALHPNGVGTGGGSGNYNYGHQALIGLEPAPRAQQGAQFDLSFSAAPTSAHTSIHYGGAFSISAGIFNKGVTDFSGDLSAAVFDANHLFVDYIEIKPGRQLKPGILNSDQLSFSSGGLTSMLPGKYYISIFYRATGGSWKPLQPADSGVKYLEIEVDKSNRIELHTGLMTDDAKLLVEGEPVAIRLDVINKGSTHFKGDYRLALYSLDGKPAGDIAIVKEMNGLPGGETYPAPHLLFQQEKLQARRGSYLLALSYREEGSERWEFAGGGLFANPVKVSVAQPALKPDQYERNNTVRQATLLPAIFLNDTAAVKTVATSIHEHGDHDYYRIELPPGFKYVVTASLRDVYIKSNVELYTLDAVFSLSEDSLAWTAPYDEEMKERAVIGGRNLYFHVSSYFAGDTGSYLLEINITKTAMHGGVNEVPSQLKVYPNPASTALFINMQHHKGNLRSIELLTLNGVSVYKHGPVSGPGLIKIPLVNQTAGVYILKLETEQGRSSQKIIINR